MAGAGSSEKKSGGGKKTRRRGRLTDAARRKGAKSKIQRGIFNRYVRAIQGPAVERDKQKIAEIEEMLERGTRLKKAPVFEDGKRVGTTEKQLPLLPSERAIWLARKAKLEESLHRRAPEELRQQFIEMLPEYAARYDLTRDILLEVGVPEEDLDEAGIEE